MSERGLSPWLSIGEGGWSLHFPTVRTGEHTTQTSTLSHYGDTWREHLDEMTDDVIGTDTRAIFGERGFAELALFTVSGPMGDATVPAGMVQTFIWKGVEPWRDEPQEGRDPRFGSAHSLDYVALDVYLTILERFGGRIFDPRAEARNLRIAELQAEITEVYERGVYAPERQLCELASLTDE